MLLSMHQNVSNGMGNFTGKLYWARPARKEKDGGKSLKNTQERLIEHTRNIRSYNFKLGQ